MTHLPADSTSGRAPDHVRVYGNDHSPWVQAVLLGLHQKQIAHTLVSVPPLEVFLDSGVLMPAAKLDDGPWRLDSERILVELGFSEVDAEARRALLAVFAGGAMDRTEQGWGFWSRFSRARDGHPSLGRRLWNHFWRPFSMLYFFTLITLGRRAGRRASEDQLTTRFSFFQDRLGPGATFFGGDTPDTVDLQLFGLVQMHASIPGRSLAVLQDDPSLGRLREWVEAMQRFFSDYDHLYSARDFEPQLPEIRQTTALERVFYWAGAALMWLALPITLPIVLYYAWRVRRKGLAP